MCYMVIYDFDINDNVMGEVGFNLVGVGMSVMEIIYNGRVVLVVDFYVIKMGIMEDVIEFVILLVV